MAWKRPIGLIALTLPGGGRGVSALMAQTAIVIATAASARITPARIQPKIAQSKAAIFKPDPKIQSSDDRSWPGTAGRFPMVPACSTASVIRHDHLGR